jgi:hypothetical protein
MHQSSGFSKRERSHFDQNIKSLSGEIKIKEKKNHP